MTNDQYAQFVAATNYPIPEGFLAAKSAMPDHPVTNASWKDALCYALWARKRLPAPLEWEKAARGPIDGRSYPWGSVWDDKRCNHDRRGEYDSTSPVGAFPTGTSPYGVLDMAGNAKEWVATGQRLGTRGSPGSRGLRGGAWADPVAIYGLVTLQVEAAIDYSDQTTGFRCAADIAYDTAPLEPTDEH